MANIRRLKKDVDYLTSAVVNDSFRYLCKNPASEDALKIINDMLDFRNDLRVRINQTPLKAVETPRRAKASFRAPIDTTVVKGYYRQLFNELLKTVDGHFTTLSETIKK